MKKIIFLLFISILMFAQNDELRISNWKNYTSYRNINSLSSSGDNIWAGTDGGVFCYNQTSKSLVKYTNVEGLSSLEITSILADTKNRIWIGSSNGKIDIYNLTNKSWTNISDIALAYSGLSKNINGFVQKNDSIYILSDFGISIYDISIKEFRDTYIKFGDFAAYSRVIGLTFSSDKIIALSTSGIAQANKNSRTLLSPTEWTSFSKAIYFEDQELVDFYYFNNSLYVLAQYGLFKQNGNSFNKISAFNQTAKKLFTDGTSLYIALEFQILKLNSSGSLLETSINFSSSLSSATFANNKMFLGFAENGMALVNNTTVQAVDLNCPYANLFNSLLVTSTGELWAASVGLQDAVQYGLYRYKDSVWTNYNKNYYPELLTNAYCSLAEGPDNSIYAGSWGRGVAKILNNKITIYNETNSPLIGISTPETGSLHFIPVGGIAKDKSGKMWFTNYLSMNSTPLLSLSTTSTWNSLVNSYNASSFYLRQMVIDQEWGTKWMISEYDPSYNGLFFYNENRNLPGSTSGWGFISNDEIYSDASNVQVQCMALDKNSQLWVGTTTGLSVIGIPTNPKQSITKPCYTTRCNISGQIINCITVDPLDNKWVGTKTTGIWVLTSDGSSVITQINTNNSKLLDDNIRSIAINPKDGTVYIGTEKGLSSFRTYLVEPQAEYSETLKLYPSPYRPEKGSLSIDGLIESSNIKIITPYGKLIKDFSSPGGRIAYWNGKDSNDEYVASGIYFVIAYSSDGSKNTIGKVAVIRSGK